MLLVPCLLKETNVKKKEKTKTKAHQQNKRNRHHKKRLGRGNLKRTLCLKNDCQNKKIKSRIIQSPINHKTPQKK